MNYCRLSLVAIVICSFCLFLSPKVFSGNWEPGAWKNTPNELAVRHNDHEMIIESPIRYNDVYVEINRRGLLMRGYKVNLNILPEGKTIIPLRKFVNSEGLRFDPNTHALTDIYIGTNDPSVKNGNIGYFKTR